MNSASRASLGRRLWAAPGVGVSMGAAAGAIEGLVAGFEGDASLLHASLFGAGLFFPFSALLSLAAIGLIFAILGPDPADRWQSAWLRFGREPESAARFAGLAVAFGSALLIFMTVVFHLSKASMSSFHHMGLAAMLLTAAFASIGLFLFLLGSRVAPIFRNAFMRLPTNLLRPLAILSLFECPAVLLGACALSPVDGSGLFGFMGLLKREELELAFLAWAIAPFLSAGLTFLFLTAKPAPLIALISIPGCAIGLGALTASAKGMDSQPRTAASIEENTGMGKRLLFALRTLTDRDRDGASGFFGGGDCDDKDAGKWPGATELPGNGIDEDCSGADEATNNSQKKKVQTADKIKFRNDQKELSLVVLSIDALRWDLGYMGYGRPVTPNLDGLAAQSVVFERAYALSSFTGRSLAPMFIGRYPSEAHCDYSHFTKYLPENDMLAEILKRAGFATAGIGSHYYFKGYGLEQGFDRYFVEVPQGDKNIDQKITSDLVADRAVEILNDPSFSSGRFFLWAHFMDPHRDYLKHDGFDFGNTARDRYDGEVAFADHHVGRVIEALRAAGLWDRTVIMVTGDHGEAFMEHDIMFHGRRLWEEVVRVPWIWRIPGMTPTRTKTRVSHIDLVATVCDLLGVEPSEKTGGTSLVSVMNAKEATDRLVFIEQLPGEYMEEMYALIDKGYKLIHKIIGNRFSLFNLEEDPREKRDVGETQTQKIEQLKNTYRTFRSGLERNAPRQ